MGFLKNIFSRPPYPAEKKQEVERLIAELIKIGKVDDFLSERPGGAFNLERRHIRARDIGKRLDEIGGFELMEFAKEKTRKSLGPVLAEHLAYAWSDIGKWIP